MVYDQTKLKDYQIAELAEINMPSAGEWAERLGLQKDEIIPYGRVAKLDFMKIIDRLKNRPDGKYINVTAITPTPFGEGKTTTTLGLVEGLGKRGMNAGAAIRQPSGGPTMNVKGTAAGGGNALAIPMTEFSLGLTGDINDIMNAHNLAMVALNARMQHERNYDDAELARRGLRRLDIDPARVEIGWVIDFCAQGLRKIIMGIGGRMDGYMMESRSSIAVSSELMSILAVATDLKDLRERVGKIIVAYDKKGNPVTTSDLEVAGAMTAFMRNAINPTLMSTVEYQPVLVHAGPFANIAIGQSSVIADRIALKMLDYNVTESGFGADIGFEKFWNIKCRLSGLVPNASVITATIRALKMHGGGPKVIAGRPLPQDYTKENLELLERGIVNLLHHISIVKKAGINPVVCVNAFSTDTKEEIAMVRRYAEQAGARFALSEHWLKGGDGALDLADAVIEACNDKVNFSYLYPPDLPLRQKVEIIAREIYGAEGVSWTL
ncbi:MAG: formate--tetrahydrofolate ligase, partial [Desulfotomaculaceae bacterium]|nr:formate--tetrahydrofolate ligase [Desulfotomaculaceae bacterium]